MRFLKRKIVNEIEGKELNNNKVIAVWGSPGSGKTTTSIKIAKALAEMKHNVIIVYDDIHCPTIPSLISDPKNKYKDRSLGKVLLNNSEQELIKENLIPIEKNKYIALLGYNKGENYLSYPDYVKEKVSDLIIQLRHLADYVIIDCSSMIKSNPFTITALEQSDAVITLSTADLKGLSYFSSTYPLLTNTSFKTDNQIVAVSNIKDFQAKETINDLLKGKEIYLDFTAEIEDQITGKMQFELLVTKDSDLYKEGLNKLIAEVFYEK